MLREAITNRKTTDTELLQRFLEGGDCEDLLNATHRSRLTRRMLRHGSSSQTAKARCVLPTKSSSRGSH